jgi:acylphosphatase
MWGDDEAGAGFLRSHSRVDRWAQTAQARACRCSGIDPAGAREEEILMNRRLAAAVRGVVQGVYFRQSTQREAVRLGLVGTVRVVAEGDAEALAQLLRWLRRGPERAVVERVDVEWLESRGELTGFHIEA